MGRDVTFIQTIDASELERQTQQSATPDSSKISSPSRRTDHGIASLVECALTPLPHSPWSATTARLRFRQTESTRPFRQTVVTPGQDQWPDDPVTPPKGRNSPKHVVNGIAKRVSRARDAVLLRSPRGD